MVLLVQVGLEFGLELGWGAGLVVGELSFDLGEEGLGWCVVVAVPNSTHRLGCFAFEGVFPRFRGVLVSLV